MERVQVLLSSYPSMHTALGICRLSRFLGICWSLSKSLSAIQLNPLLLLIFLLIYCFPQTLFIISAAAAKSLQSCPTLCDPIDGSLPGSPIPGILQARTLEWVAISFSNAWKWKVKVRRSVVSDFQRPHGLQPTRLLHPWGSLGKSTGAHKYIYYTYTTHTSYCSVSLKSPD